MRRSLTIAFIMVALIMSVFNKLAMADTGPHMDLNKFIKPANRKKMYEARSTSQWKNPFITIYDETVRISWGPNQEHNKDVRAEAIGSFLIGLPVSAWPDGRMIGLTQCGVCSSSTQSVKFRKRSWVQAEAVLKKLDILINYWPSG